MAVIEDGLRDSGRLRTLDVIAIGAALVIGAAALLVGGGWAIVIVEAGVALLVVITFLVNFKRGGDGDAAA